MIALRLVALVLLAAGSAAAAPPPPEPAPPPPDFDTADPVAYGTALKRYVDLIDSGWKDDVTVSSMTLRDASGDAVKRSVSQMILERPDGDKSLIRFRTPAEIKGVAALTHQHPGGTDDSWLYLPASRRVRRISGANKTASFQGTEFTYEDLGQPELEDYTWTHLGMGELTDGSAAHRLQAEPKDSDSGYSRSITWVHAEHWRTEKTEFFDKAGESLKVMEASDWELVHGRWWRPKRMVMTNLQTRKSTEMEFQKRFLDMSRYPGKGGKVRRNLNDEQFTTRRLEGR